MAYDNVAVYAPSEKIAHQITEAVVKSQKETARVWLGYKPKLHPCFVNVRIAKKPWAWTSYQRFGVVIDAEGTAEEIFSTIIPHEVAHTVIAEHFAFNPPQWLDEGIAVSHETKNRFQGKCGNIPFSHFFDIKGYPRDWEFYYGQCYSVTTHLVQRYGRDVTFEFARQGNSRGFSYSHSCRKYFDTSLQELEREWRVWQSAREPYEKG
jgi:hypothetical protein